MFSRLCRFVSWLIGDFSWSPPGWLRRSAGAGGSWIKGHRILSVVLFLAVFAAVGGGLWYADWKKRQPKPQTISVSVEAPAITPLEKANEPLKPRPLIVKFGGSVARIEAFENRFAEVSSGVRLEPPLEGHWHWKSDNRLEFLPKNDWPAERTFRVILASELTPSHVLLEKREVEFTTPPFSATLKKAEFYTDPTDPTIKQVVATFEFSHAVDPGAFQKQLELEAVGESQMFKPGAPRFSLIEGAHHRVIHVRSSPLLLPEHEDFLRVRLPKGLATTQGGALTHEDREQKVRVPDLYSIFRITSVKAEIVRNNEGDPEQMLLVETSTAAKPEEIRKTMRVYLLPKKDAEEGGTESGRGSERRRKKEPQWTPKEVDEALLAKATQLPFTLLPSEEAHTSVHAFKISLEAGGQLAVTVEKGATALGGFVLGEDYTQVLAVPELPREIVIQGTGGVLALGGERKIAIKSRAVSLIEYSVARVPADQINHLVSQTRGEFQNPDFVNYRFDEENIARIFSEKQAIRVTSKFKANYSAFDFGRYLQPANDGGSALQGLFLLKAHEVKPKKGEVAEGDENSGESDREGDEEDDTASDRRFILVTDLGLIVKENADGGRDVFIASIRSGTPVPEVAVEVLAKNGVPLLSGKTGADGRVTFASLGKSVREKKPVAFVARLANDVAFMPYDREDRKLDFSRFDTGGVQSASGADLDAFVFTERGIYRPGDEIRIGLIVKQRDWAGKLEGLPVETEIIDARGTSVQVRKLALPAMGFAETSYRTAYESPTGQYEIHVYLVRDGKRDIELGGASVTVKEFLPDRMKIESRLSKDDKGGWVHPEGIEAAIALRNLYGTPATERRLKAHLVLSHTGFSFEQYRDYHFFDWLPWTKDQEQSQTVELGDQTTDAEGNGRFELKLERFTDATYSAGFYVEGFEAESGRSVATSNRLLISPLPFVIGYKADGALDYIPMGSVRMVSWLALDPTLKKIALPDLEARLVEHRTVSVLTKGENGSWTYQSVNRDFPVRTEALSIGAEGLQAALPTDVPGDYSLALFDKEHTAALATLRFSVVGRGAVSRALDRDAELQVKLSKGQYNTGEDIELSIVAPYTGSGLITIERDKVYAHAWFKADATSSIQRIRVPEGFEGTGYVNVSFVRALDSKEVLMSPLSYAVVPFRANIEKRRLPIELRVAEKAKPGEPLRIGFKTDRPSKIVIFAVDQGILQVSNYKLPDPLGYFFRKEALMVGTAQIVDLILPEYSILKKAAAFGGDGEEKRLNPFKRVTEKPVVFWSGIIDAEPREREVVYEVPDYFSGTLTVMAVAMAPDGVGSVEKDALIRGPFVLSPNVPTVAAPGDVFEASVTVANGVEGSGANAEVTLGAAPSEHLEILKAPPQPIRIAEGTETSATFTFKAKGKFGPAEVVFKASALGQESKVRSTLSVRPPVPFMTDVRGGNFSKETLDVKMARVLHPDFRKLQATISAVPLGLAHGLDFYLKNYPNGCTEQVVSGAFCRLALSDEADFGLSRAEVLSQMERTFGLLRRRQNDQGSFGYWAPDNNAGLDFVSAYAMHFLIEAKAAGFAPPPAIFQSGLRHLQAVVVLEPASLREARIEAYAIYLLTREGVITTNYILNLRDYLGKHYAKEWPADLTAVYLAGADVLLKKNEEALALVKNYRLGTQDPRQRWDFYSPLGADSQYVALVARHFPELLKKISASEFEAVVKPVGTGDFNTLSAAYAVLALKNYSHFMAQSAPVLNVTSIDGQKKESPLRLEGEALLKRGSFPADSVALRFSARNLPKNGMGAFYQVIEAGYDAVLPDKIVKDGLEISREFIDAKGRKTSTTRLGEPVSVNVRIRTLKPGEVSNVAIVDLLPGGFELAAGSLTPGVGSAGCDYVDVREDRVVFFATVGPRVRTISYRIKATNRGEFVVPPPFAEAMYDRTIQARGLSSRITVVDGK